MRLFAGIALLALVVSLIWSLVTHNWWVFGITSVVVFGVAIAAMRLEEESIRAKRDRLELEELEARKREREGEE